MLALPGVAGGQPEPAALTEATMVERDEAVEVWVRLSRAARYRGELIDHPFRLVLDFEDTAYRWTARPVPVAADPVRELRGSQFRKGVARLVIELRRKVAYTIDEDREGLRIVFPRGEPAVATPAGTSSGPRATPPPGPGPKGPLVYGILMLDQRAHAYIFDPATGQVRRYAEGDAIGNAVVETIADRHVVLRTPTGRVELRVDDARRKPTPPRPPAARPR